MSEEVIRIVGELAVEQELGLPCAATEDSRRAICEAAGFDWLAILKWLADNRDNIRTLIDQATVLVRTFPKPQSAVEAAAATQPGPEAIDPATIILLITTLAPMLAKMIEGFRGRRNPTPTPAIDTV